jgi:hypothetical protein
MPADEFDFPDLPDVEFPELGEFEFAAEYRAPTVPDPLAGLKSTGSVEVDSKAEVSAVLQGFKDRAKAEAKRFELATDSEYWFAVCFQSREQKEQFLRGLQMLADGDKYLDGRKLAAKMGIKLNDDVAISRVPRIDPKFSGLAR